MSVFKQQEPEILTMMEAVSSDDSPIRVQNGESELGCLYKMNEPFQVTLECCGVDGIGDYINVVTLSPNHSLLYQETMDSKNHSQTKRLMHFHDYFEFVVVLEGNIVQKIEGKDYPYSAGSCCLINRSLCHLEQYQKGAKVLFIGMSPEFMGEFFSFAQTPFFEVEKRICDSEIFAFVTSDLNNPGAKAYLDFIPTCQNQQFARRLHGMAENMIQILLNPDFGASYQIRGLLCDFLSELSNSEHYHCTNVQLDTCKDFLLFSRITHLFEESDGRMNRAALAERLNYSGDYLNRIVHKYTDMCLYNYGMTFCLKRAARDLLETRDSVGEIAERLGFTNRTHFYRLFREKYGVTPKEYRQKHS
ncbi:MAG: helix-turn-helix domain-containing protein [Roseburia sp.]